MVNDVRALRTAKGMSQQALGEALGASRQTVNVIGQGRYDPSLPGYLAGAISCSRRV